MADEATTEETKTFTPADPAALIDGLDRELEAEAPELRDQFEDVLAEFAKRKWSELEAIEHAGYVLFPDRIARRRKSGKFEVVEVMVRVLRQDEMRAARAEAREIMKADGLDPKEDADLFANLENICILARAIRNKTAPHEAWEPNPRILEKTYDTMSLDQIWKRLDAYNKLLDPRPDAIGKAEFVALVAAVAESRSIVPLVAIGGSARATYEITTAKLLHAFLSRSSSSPSSATSTPEPLPSPSSGGAPG